MTSVSEQVNSMVHLNVNPTSKFIENTKSAATVRQIVTIIETKIINPFNVDKSGLRCCDTVSYLYRRGNKRASQTALNCKEHLKPLGSYGESGRDKGRPKKNKYCGCNKIRCRRVCICAQANVKCHRLLECRGSEPLPPCF